MANEIKWRYVEDLSGTRFPSIEAVRPHLALAGEEFKQAVLSEFGVSGESAPTTSPAHEEVNQ